MVNHYSGRDDLLVSCVWEPPGEGEAPAYFLPLAGRVVINMPAALGDADPSEVNPLTGPGRREHPVLIGLAAHEAAHAKHTAYDDDSMSFRSRVRAETPAVADVMELLEEPRIELRHLVDRPQDRRYLRAQALLVDLAPFATPQGPIDPDLDRWQAASAATLVWGRVRAGSLARFDAEPVREALVGILGEVDFEDLILIVERATALDGHDLAGQESYAREWLSVVQPGWHAGAGPGEAPAVADMLSSLFGCAGMPQEATEENADEGDDDPWGLDSPITETPAPTVDGDSSEGAVSGSDDRDDEDDALGGPGRVLGPVGAALKALRADLEAEVESDVALAAADRRYEETRGERARAHRELDREVERQTSRARQTFGDSAEGSPDIRLDEPVDPTDADWMRARLLGRAFRQAQLRARTPVESRSMFPPGRLDGRLAMLGAAQRARGQMVTAEPFKTVRNRPTHEPPLRLGTLVDTSGSMRWAEQILPRIAWALAHAVRQTRDSKAATVLIGKGVTALSQPGEVPAKVQLYSGGGGAENFRAGFDALNGALHLTATRGARLLVVLSDGLFTPYQTQCAIDTSEAVTRSGGLVLWVGPVGSEVPEAALFAPVPLITDEVPRSGRRDAHHSVAMAGTDDAIASVIAEAVCSLLRSVRQ